MEVTGLRAGEHRAGSGKQVPRCPRPASPGSPRIRLPVPPQGVASASPHLLTAGEDATADAALTKASTAIPTAVRIAPVLLVSPSTWPRLSGLSESSRSCPKLAARKLGARRKNVLDAGDGRGRTLLFVWR